MLSYSKEENIINKMYFGVYMRVKYYVSLTLHYTFTHAGARDA